MKTILIDGSVMNVNDGGCGIVVYDHGITNYNFHILTKKSSVAERMAAIAAYKLLTDDEFAIIKTDCRAVMKCINNPDLEDPLDTTLHKLIISHNHVNLIIVQRSYVEPAHKQARIGTTKKQPDGIYAQQMVEKYRSIQYA